MSPAKPGGGGDTFAADPVSGEEERVERSGVDAGRFSGRVAGARNRNR